MFKITIKDLKLFLTDRRARMLTFLLPIALITLFALAFGAMGGKNKSHTFELLLSDEDNTKASHNAIELLDSVKHLKLIPKPLAEAQNLVKKGKYDGVIILHKGFGDSLANGGKMPLEIQYDEAQEAELGMLQQSLMPTLFKMPMTGAGDMKKSMHGRFDKMLGTKDVKVQHKVNSQFDTLYETIQKTNPKKGSAGGWDMSSDIKMTKLVVADNDNALALIQAVAGTAIMMLLFSVAGMGASLLDEKQEGTLKRLLYSPVPPMSILFGKMMFATIIAIMQLTIMFLFAWIVFGLKIMENIPSLIVMILATAFACSSFGVFLASFAKSRSQVTSMATLIVLVMSCIGGSMIPLFFMPEWMSKIAVVSINYWGIQGFFDIFWRKLPITDSGFMMKVGILVGIGLVMNIISVRLFKKNILTIA